MPGNRKLTLIVRLRDCDAQSWRHFALGSYCLKNQVEVEVHKSQTATIALERIAELYAVEREIWGLRCEERREIRNRRSRPLLESLKQWLKETLGKLSRKSDTA
jgi:hypothetical protein